jgi:peptidoglycan/LPS O-acetylase OafA/YrhL
MIILTLFGNYSKRDLEFAWWCMASWVTFFGQFHWNFSHLWSLSVEEQFYLIWPLVLAVGGLFGMRVVCYFWIVASCCVRYWMIHHGYYLPALFSPVAVMDAICVGCLFAQLKKKREIVLSYGWVAWIVALVIPLCKEFGSLDVLRPIPQVIGHLVWSIFALAVGIGMLWAIEARPRVLNNRVFTAVGLMSYSLYLWQMPFMNPDITLPWEVRLSLTFIAALASFYLVEVPMLIIRENGLKKTWKLTMWTLSRPRWSQRNNGEVFRRRMLQWMENEPQ